MSLLLKGGAEFPAVRFDKAEKLLLSADIRSDKSVESDGSSVARSGLDVCAVIDRSGSMYGELDLVKETLVFMISKLSDIDQCSIVCFGSAVSVELQMTKMTDIGTPLFTSIPSFSTLFPVFFFPLALQLCPSFFFFALWSDPFFLCSR